MDIQSWVKLNASDGGGIKEGKFVYRRQTDTERVISIYLILFIFSYSIQILPSQYWWCFSKTQPRQLLWGSPLNVRLSSYNNERLWTIVSNMLKEWPTPCTLYFYKRLYLSKLSKFSQWQLKVVVQVFPTLTQVVPTLTHC